MSFGGSGGLSFPESVGTSLGTSDFTVELWVNARSVSGAPFLLSQGAGGMSLALLPQLAFGREEIDWLLFDGQSFPLNSWVHIGVTRSAGTSYLFKQGVLIGTYSGAFDLQGSSALSIGYRGWTGGNFFDGSISNVRKQNFCFVLFCFCFVFVLLCFVMFFFSFFSFVFVFVFV